MKNQVEITTFKDGTARIIVDGKDLSIETRSLSFEAGVRTTPTLILEYGCYEQSTIEGEMDVVHVCPKKAR